MGTNKIVADMMLIVIPIAAILLFISIAWKQVPNRCWENLNGSKEGILISLRKCINNCWSKHDFGAEPIIDDCYSISMWIEDKDITKKDLEGIEKYVKSYLEGDLIKKTQYNIKIRYNYTGSEISLVNVAFCGNKIVEIGEGCDGDISTCKDSDYSYGVCSDKVCSEACFCGKLNCEIQECKNGIPTSGNPNTDTDWCRYCKARNENICDDGVDNDCDGLIDMDDGDCITTPIIILPDAYNILFVPIHYSSGEFSKFKQDSDPVINHFLKISPFKNCPNPRSRINTLFIEPSECQESCSGLCGNCLEVVSDCAKRSQYKNIYDIVVGICEDNSCDGHCDSGNYCGISSSSYSVTNIGDCFGDPGYKIAVHEMGHLFGLGHVNCGNVGCTYGAPNDGDCSPPQPSVDPNDIMGYCNYNEFGVNAYKYLKNRVFKDYLVGC